MNCTRTQWRRGSVFAAAFRPLDRNQCARILYLAEALDRRTHQPGKHGGILGRTGLAVLRALACRFLNKQTGRLDPSLAAIAKAANIARSTVQEAVKRLQAAGLLEIERRVARVRVRYFSEAVGRVVEADRIIQQTNAYRLNVPLPDRAAEGDMAAQPRQNRASLSDTGTRSETTNPYITKPSLEDIQDPGLRSALAKLGRAVGLTNPEACPA
jgi:DNA-binding MarR family transcriptional regulator